MHDKSWPRIIGLSHAAELLAVHREGQGTRTRRWFCRAAMVQAPVDHRSEVAARDDASPLRGASLALQPGVQGHVAAIRNAQGQVPEEIARAESKGESDGCKSEAEAYGQRAEWKSPGVGTLLLKHASTRQPL